MSEKLLRHNVCALLHEFVPSVVYDPINITRMRIIPHERPLPPLVVERVTLKRDVHRRDDAWNCVPMAV